MRGAFSEERRFYDRHGKIYKFGRVTPEPQVSGFQRFLAHICYNPVTKFDVEFKALGEAGLEDLKIRIRDLLANDPGDLLYQWADAQEWEAGLNETDSIPELFDFITKRALAEHCHQNTAEGEDAADGEALPGSCDPH